MTEINHNEDLINKPVPKLIKIIAWPAAIGFFFNTMYNVVDTWVAGQISSEALAALSITFPVLFIVIAVSMGISTAVTILVANELGAKRKAEAKHYATQGIIFGTLISLLLSIVGYFSAETLFKILGADGSYLDIALVYMQTIFLGSIFFGLNSVFNGILNAIGDTKSYRNILVAGFFVNLILSPILAFGWSIFPELGVFGIAIATIISNLLGFIYLLYKVRQTNLVEIKKLLSPKLQAFIDLSTQGLPASFSMLTVAIGAFIITYFISQYGENAVAGYGAAIRIEQIALIPAIGINIAVLTLIGQNNGAKNLDRVRETIKYGIRYILIINTFASVFILLSGNHLLKLFTDVPEVIAFGVEYLFVAALMTWAYGLIFVTESALRGLKRPNFPMIIGIIRQIILPLPLFYLVTFTLNLGMSGLWWSLFIIIWLAAITSLAYTNYILHNKI